MQEQCQVFQWLRVPRWSFFAAPGPILLPTSDATQAKQRPPSPPWGV